MKFRSNENEMMYETNLWPRTVQIAQSIYIFVGLLSQGLSVRLGLAIGGQLDRRLHRDFRLQLTGSEDAAVAVVRADALRRNHQLLVEDGWARVATVHAMWVDGTQRPGEGLVATGLLGGDGRRQGVQIPRHVRLVQRIEWRRGGHRRRQLVQRPRSRRIVRLVVGEG